MKNQQKPVLSVVPRGEEDYYIDVNKDHLMTEGVRLIKDLLNALQVYKSMAAEDLGRALYAKYSKVEPDMMKIRARIKDRSEAQVLNLAPGLKLEMDKPGVHLPEYFFYPKSIEGIIESHREKLPFTE